MKKIVLIDGHSILTRAFYGVPDLTDHRGRHTNAVYGFLNIMFKVIDEEQPDSISVAFDVRHPTFRHEIYKEYKGTRKPMPIELHEQVPIIKEVLMAMNIPVIECPGFEADDIIGTIAGMAERQDYKVTIISGDRDLLQLVTDNITLRIPKTRGGKTVVEDYDPDTVREVYNLSPNQIIDLKGLMGDSSDNIPGLPGVGEKTATKLLCEYGTVENVIEHAEEIKPNKAKNAVMEHKDLAILSKELATIKTDCTLDYSLEDSAISDMFNDKAYVLIKDMDFKSMFNRFESAGADKEEEQISYKLVGKKEDIDENIARICNILTENKKNMTQADDVKLTDAALAAIYIIRDTKAIDKDNRYGVLGAVIECGKAEADSGNKSNGENEPAGNAGADSEDAVLFLGNMEEELKAGIVRLIESGADVAMYDVKEQLDYLDISYKENVWDAGIAAYLINPLKDSYTGADIARDYLGEQIKEYQELFGKSSAGEALGADRQAFIDYCIRQCRVLRRGFAKIREKLAEEDMYELYRDIEMPLVYTLHNMEKEGIGADREALARYGQSLSEGILDLEKKIYEYAGEEFNINSPKQLGIILFEKLKLPYAKKTKTGYSTSADILDKLRNEDPIVNAVLEYRTLTKLKSTYADGLAAFIREDGRIHGKFNQTKTATGRISSMEPNLQNIPVRMELGKQIRKVFVPREGCVFLDADYSQIELRVLAHMSGDENMIEAYNEGEDIHAITASKVFHVPADELTPELRRRAKAVNFGIIYGISSYALSQDLNITKKEADEYIKKYFETYPKIKTFLDMLVETARILGYSITEYKRRRPIPELASSNFMQRSFGERVAMNAPIQGTAADIIKIAMVRVERRLREENLKTKLILQVHDELLLESPFEEAEKAADILREEMVCAANMSVAMEVEVKEGSDWYEAK